MAKSKRIKISDEEVARIMEEFAEAGERSPMAEGSQERGLSKLGVADFISAYRKGRKYLVTAGTALSLFQPKAAAFIAQLIVFMDKLVDPAAEEA